MKRRVISIVLALGLTLGVFVGSIGAVPATPQVASFTLLSGDSSDLVGGQYGMTGAYFPWVAYGSELNGMGPFYGAVTVQNLEDEPRDLFFFAGAGVGDHAYAHPQIVANVQPNASVTLNAGQLSLAAPGGSVRVHSFPTGTGYDSSSREISIDEEDGESNIALGMVAGTVKNVSPVPSSSAKTSDVHITVDGYSGLNASQISDDFDQHVLPIVQTNSGWNTKIHLASFAGENDPNAATVYTVHFYAAGSQGGAGASVGTFTGDIKGGEVVTLDLAADPGIPEGWVGSAYVSANAPIGAVAERYKSETEMLLTNVSRPVDISSTTQVAPLVFQNYNNWNSGISVANTSEYSATVNVSYVTPGGSQVGADQITIPARAMEFIYKPAGQDLGINEFVGAALIQSSQPVHVAVDQVKYAGEGSDIGDAMSYVTDGDFAGDYGQFQVGRLALPLVQKGNPATGLGDTTGIQFFNGSPQYSVPFEVFFYDTTGNRVAPTLNPNFGLQFNLSGHQGVTVYTHNYSEMPAGFQGSAVAYVGQGVQGSLYAVSNNVNYATGADGAAVFNLVRPDDSIYFEQFFEGGQRNNSGY